MIGASNFFELTGNHGAQCRLFGVSSGAALAAVVGVLVEVPVMLMLVRIANATRRPFRRRLPMSADGASGWRTLPVNSEWLYESVTKA